MNLPCTVAGCGETLLIFVVGRWSALISWTSGSAGLFLRSFLNCRLYQSGAPLTLCTLHSKLSN